MIFKTRNMRLVGTAAATVALMSAASIAQQDNTTFLTATDATDGISINARARGTYSDNILRFSDIEEAEELVDNPDLSLSDYVLDVGGNLTWRKRIGRNALSLDAGAGYRFHNNNTILDNERLNGTALFAWQLGTRCTGSFGGTWSRALAQFETVEDIADNLLTRLSGGGQATCNLLNSLQANGSVVFSESDNSSAIRSLNDFNNTAYTGSLRYAFGRGSFIGAFYQYTDTTFTNIGDGNQDSGFTTTTIGGEVNLVFGRGITILASLGAINVEGEGGFDAESRDLDGVSGRLTASIPIGANQQVDLTAFQDVRALESVAAAVSRVKGGNVSWTARWSPRFTSQFNIGYEDRVLTQEDSVLNQISDDETFRYGVNFDYRLGRLITLTLQGNINDRNALVDRFDFRENSVIFGVTVNFN